MSDEVEKVRLITLDSEGAVICRERCANGVNARRYDSPS